MGNRDIIKIQNEDEYIDLLKAQRVAYSKAKFIQSLNTILVVLSLIIPFIMWYNKNLNNSLTIFGAFITVLYLAIQFLEKKNIETAANIQEQFDTNLFNMKWNTILAGEKVSSDTIFDLKNKSREEKEQFTPWYSKEIKKNIPLNFKILLCQRSNLTYDIDLKEKFINLLIFITVIYYMALLIMAISKGMSITDFILFLSPTMAFLFYSIQTIKGLLGQKKAQKQLLNKIDSFIENKQMPSDEELRDIQNMIYTQRTTIEKIPDWFYKLNRNKNEIKIDELVKQKVKKLGF